MSPRMKKPAEQLRDNIASTVFNDVERQYLQRYLDFTGFTTSQVLRRGTQEILVREAGMPNPLAKYMDAHDKTQSNA